MFDNLLGSKFSNKCKQSVRGIKCRLETIRKKKHAMVRYLKKDVADLIASGHDANAYGRMDALIFEVNQAWCYDLIGNFCCCILENLPTMRKKRECPEETVEAVATLIFAAARFSDLPELIDLRSCFTDRYGSKIESKTNTEFVEKVQTKSFSQDKKLQSMQDIAQEFTVKWDAKPFEYTVSTSSTPAIDQTRMHFYSSDENDQPSPSSHGKNEALDRSNAMSNGSQNIEPHYLGDRVPHTKTNHCEGNPHGTSASVNEGLSSVSMERQGRTDKVSTMNPPYCKHSADFNGTSSSLYRSVHLATEPGHNGQAKLHNGAENSQNINRATNLRPPYVKPMVTKHPLANGYSHSDYGDYLNNTISFSEMTKRPEEATATSSASSQSKRVEDDPICGSIYHGRSMYRSLSSQPRYRPHSKDTGDNPQTHSIHEQRFTPSQSMQREDDSICGIIVHGRRMYQALSDQPRHGTSSKDDDCYGHPTRSLADKAGAQEQSFKDEEYSMFLAGTSNGSACLPSAEALGGKQVRSFSMQPDRASPNGRSPHPKLPQYDDLAARIAALRNS